MRESPIGRGGRGDDRGENDECGREGGRVVNGGGRDRCGREGGRGKWMKRRGEWRGKEWMWKGRREGKVEEEEGGMMTGEGMEVEGKEGGSISSPWLVPWRHSELEAPQLEVYAPVLGLSVCPVCVHRYN